MHQNSLTTKTLTILVGHKRVTGKYSYTSDCLRVEILEPYNYFTGGSYVPYFAKKYRNFNQIGADSATRILEFIYLLSDYVENNKEFLLRELKKLEDEIAVLSGDYIDDLEFLLRRKKLKVKLYASDPLKYQGELIKLTKVHKEWQNKIIDIFADFFKSSFPVSINVGNQEEIVKLLGNVRINQLFKVRF